MTFPFPSGMVTNPEYDALQRRRQSLFTGHPMTIDPEWPLDVHMVLGTLGWDLPEAFRLPDMTSFTERNCRAYELRCHEILLLPIDGAYRRLIQEVHLWAQLARSYQTRADYLTRPLMDEGADEGQQRIAGFLT